MHHKRSLLSLCIVLILLTVPVACGGDTEEEPSTDTPTILNDTPIPELTATAPSPATDAPTAGAPAASEGMPEKDPTSETAEEEIAVVVEDAAERGDAQNPPLVPVNLPSDVLDSFRSQGNLVLTTTFEDGATEVETLSLEAGYEKAGNDFTFNQFFQLGAVRSDSDLPRTVAIYEVDNVVATLFEGEWRTINRSDAILSMASNPFNTPLVQFSTGLTGAEVVGTEAINDIEANHYRITDPDLFLDAARLEMAEGQEIESVQIDVWVAADGNYIVGYAMMATINDAVDFDAEGNQIRSDQNIDWRFDLYEINNTISVELPAEAPEPSAFAVPGFAENEFPLPVDAEMRINMFGQTEITTDLSEDEVFDFYTQTLSELGWSIEGNFGVYEATKEDLGFNMTTMTTEHGKTMVQIRNR